MISSPPASRKVRQAQFIRAAAALGREIGEHAIPAEEGGVSWLDTRPLPGAAPGKLGADLYGGSAGIALFLAALARVTGDEASRDLARRALVPLCGETVSDREPIGGLLGLGSRIYSFLRIGEMLDDPTLVVEAHGWAARLTPERIARARSLDVTTGCAGALLALLALDHRELAEDCGRRLLEARVAHSGALRAWTGGDGVPASGFAHGSAGIGHALLRLYRRTGEPELREAALEGFAFERTLYMREQRNWRRIPGDEGPFMSTWCNGAPGIALGRLEALDIGGHEVRAELDAALEATRSYPPSSLDHLCCGNLGRAGILFQASRKLGDERLADAAYDLAYFVLRRARTRGSFGLSPRREDDSFHAPLFKGLSGIGLTLLHLARPDLVPFVPALD